MVEIQNKIKLLSYVFEDYPLCLLGECRSSLRPRSGFSTNSTVCYWTDLTEVRECEYLGKNSMQIRSGKSQERRPLNRSALLSGEQKCHDDLSLCASATDVSPNVGITIRRHVTLCRFRILLRHSPSWFRLGCFNVIVFHVF